MTAKNRLYPEHRINISSETLLPPRAHTITALTRRVLVEVLQQQRKWKDGQWCSYATSRRSGKQDVSSLCITSATFSTDGTHRAPQLPEIWL